MRTVLFLKKRLTFPALCFLKLVDQRQTGRTAEDFIGSNLIDEGEFKKILEFAALANKIGNGITEVVLKKKIFTNFTRKKAGK